MSVLLRNITIALASFFLLMGVLGLFKMPKAPEIIGMEKVAEFIESEELAKIAIEGDTLHLFFKSGE